MMRWTFAGLALLIYSEMHQWHWVDLIGGVVAAAAVLRLFVWWVRMRCTRLILTNKRGALTTGVFRRALSLGATSASSNVDSMMD